MTTFTHLHVHTQYSILDGASNIPVMLKKAQGDGMTAVAITDHGNMFGVKDFYNTAKKQGIKPILGCESYFAHKSRFDQSDKEDRGGYHIILMAKNLEGYHNLMKVISLAWVEGFYYKPRIDQELLEKYHEGLIISSACLAGEIPSYILKGDLEKAEARALEFQKLMGDDFYLELMRHKTGDPKFDDEVYERQEKVNKGLLEISKKHGIKVIATNDVHFVNAEDAAAHDRLICLNTGKDLDDPTRMRYTGQEFFKTTAEMSELFADIPEAIANTQEIADKVEIYELHIEPIMPDFPLPEQFKTAYDYLEYLTYEGAKTRYPDIEPKTKERIDFELSVIKHMGFSGYFLIVQDFLCAARKMGVSVGPGRGSAAGSVVAYCLSITQIDPIKYDLLFERFLNPDRISMPDIDIDLDDDGREKVIQYVVKKYGRDHVAHIITFGTMAAKMAIRDVARVQKLPLSESDRLAKLVPEKPGTTIAKAYEEVPELKEARNSSDELVRKTLEYAETLEGSVRHTGIHACGIIIGRDDLKEHIPVCKSSETDLLVTQYEGSYVEDVGMLKMDFLGLKTLSIIKDALENIKESKGIDEHIEKVSLEDEKTFELFSKGETTAVFQFESPGMKKNLRELKPNRFEDLIAMNALYRPGPMDYIPSFINRKLGKEKIEYDIPVMETYLKDTYGITVYQEQVMQVSQAIASFTRGEADTLRKAMGKKKKDVMAKMYTKFIEGCTKNGYEESVAKKIWSDWEAFAQYAFNKSHSTCYAYVAYQTAYLKAHYPAEFMAAVLSRNITDIKKITTFMDECKRMGMKVLGPDVNESRFKFAVNKDGNIRFGLGAIKGVGEAAVGKIIEDREANGPFKDIFDFVERVNLQSVNKKNQECLASSGAFDCFPEIDRSQFFALDAKGSSFLENLIRYGNKAQQEKNVKQVSLFGSDAGFEMTKPEIPQAEKWSTLERLNKEKDLIGMYLSAHPLDTFKLEINHFTNTSLSQLNGDLKELNGREVCFAGIVTAVRQAMTKTGNPYGSMTIEDYTDSYTLMMFSKDYVDRSKFFVPGYSLLIKARVQPKRYRENELEVRIKSISMLADVKDEMIKSISFSVPLQQVNDQLIDEIKGFSDEKGKIALKFYVWDAAENMAIELRSRSVKVSLTEKLLHYLDERPEIECKINQ